MFSLFISLSLLAVASTLVLASLGRRRRNTPPGPKGYLLLGNLFDLTLKELWLRATDWAERYGDMVYLQVLGQGILFLNSYDVAVELLEKRGAMYADRPRMVMCAELCGCENIIAFAPPGDRFRRHRRMMQSALGASSIKSYQPLLMAETSKFLQRMMELPDDYMGHLRRYICRTFVRRHPMTREGTRGRGGRAGLGIPLEGIQLFARDL